MNTLNVIALFIGERGAQLSDKKENQILTTLSIQCILHKNELQNTQQHKQSLEKIVEESLKKIDDLNTLNLTQNAWNKLLMKCKIKCINPIDENLSYLPIKPYLEQLQTITIEKIIQNTNNELQSLYQKCQKAIEKTFDSQILLNNEERARFNQIKLNQKVYEQCQEQTVAILGLQALTDKERRTLNKRIQLGQTLQKSFNEQKKEIETLISDLEKKIENENEIRRRTTELPQELQNRKRNRTPEERPQLKHLKTDK